MRYARLAAAWSIGAVIAAYCLIFGLPVCLALWLFSSAGAASAWLYKKTFKLQRQLSRPANWLFSVATKVHPDGRKS